MLVSSKQVTVWPDYRQFYLVRSSVDQQTVDIATIDYEAHFDEIDGYVMVGTSMRSSGTQLTVEIHDAEPGTSPDADHIAETQLGGSGPLEIWSWGTDEPETLVDLPTGGLRLRSSWFRLNDAATHPDNDSGGEGVIGPETITVQIWPSDLPGQAVLRVFPSHWC